MSGPVSGDTGPRKVKQVAGAESSASLRPAPLRLPPVGNRISHWAPLVVSAPVSDVAFEGN